tara:strand:- start:44 stop:172 length:129 start_codon:yes stop_codon:yes gene_type:complete
MFDMALLSVLRRWHFRDGMPIREITRGTANIAMVILSKGLVN